MHQAANQGAGVPPTSEYIVVTRFPGFCGHGTQKFRRSQTFVHNNAFLATETRRILSLDGIWRFCFDPVQGRTAEGIEKDFPQQGLPETIAMPVPSAWNDLFEEQKDRDFVGWVWYEREFYIAQQIPT